MKRLSAKQAKCRCCGKLFILDPRNVSRQHFCERSICRKASKAASQRRWLRKRGNGDHFRGEGEVRRVQRWRESHPGYWRNRRTSDQTQMPTAELDTMVQESRNAPGNDLGTLQDSFLARDPMFLGLISVITGSTLQDVIESMCRNLIARGCEILRSKGATSAPSAGLPSGPGN